MGTTMSFFNQRRLIIYPRIIAAVFAGFFIINAASRQGWKGGIGTLIGFDFLTLYAIGEIYLNDIEHLYDIPALYRVEQEIYTPTDLGGGGNIFPYPPYVASISSILTTLKFEWAFWLWTLFSILLTIVAVYWMQKYLVRKDLADAGITFFQLSIIIFSFFPYIFGLNLGQNHAISLFLLTGIIVFTLKEKWYLAGIFLGFLIYKPHYVIGFVLLWVVWRKYKALASFSVIAIVWVMTVVIDYGFHPFMAYIRALPTLMNITYGVSRFEEVTLFALVSTMFPPSASATIIKFSFFLIFIFVGALVFAGLKSRTLPITSRIPALIFALLLPFFIAPHVLAHDMVILLLVLLLWTQITLSQRPLYMAIIIYIGSFLLLFITYPTGIALLAIIPIALLILILFDSLPIFSNTFELPQ